MGKDGENNTESHGTGQFGAKGSYIEHGAKSVFKTTVLPTGNTSKGGTPSPPNQKK